MSISVYQIITEKIMDGLKAGKIPWRKPWTGGAENGPKNLISKRGYSGINIWLLALSGFANPYWLTFKQIASLKGTIKIGEEKKSTIITFWKMQVFEKMNEDTGKKEKKNVPLLRYFKVWNLEQVNGIETPNQPTKKIINPIQNAENLISGYNCVPVSFGSSRACYNPSRDQINMPDKSQFSKLPEFYSTLYHEYIHSTGHNTRLNRDGVSGNTYFGDTLYSKEELIAEMGAAYLSAMAGIENDTLDNSQAYINNWLSMLEKDEKIIVHAAAAAQKAVNYILIAKEKETEIEPE